MENTTVAKTRRRNKLTLQRRGRDVLTVAEGEAADYVRLKVSIDPQGRIIIPATVREELGIRPNDRFILTASSEGIMLRKLEHEKSATA